MRAVLYTAVLVISSVILLCVVGNATADTAVIFDKFNGPKGAPPNSDIWVYDPGGPADHQLQTYTESTDNIRLDGKGHMVIQAQKAGDQYTSGRLVTRANVLYGTISARIKMPSGQGIWPAFWLLGSDYPAVGWPQCGEIDIMELVNVGTAYYVTLHGPQGDSDYQPAGVGNSGSMGDLSADFHEYWLKWRPESITIGVDGTTLGSFTPASLPAGAQWVFDHPMYVVLNVAVGGDWPGPPNDSTPFPAIMLVDWFRYTPGR